MNNNIQDIKDRIVFRYSISLGTLWVVTSIWLHPESIDSIFSQDCMYALTTILMLIGLPSGLISLFVKRYNDIYVQCKMNVRKASIRKGVLYGTTTYILLLLLFYFLLNIDATGIYSTAALIVGCGSAYQHLKNNLEGKR